MHSVVSTIASAAAMLSRGCFSCVGRPSSAPPVRDELDPDDDDDLDMLKGALYKRKDFLGIEEEGKIAPLLTMGIL